jgi:hypothetical protein
MAQVTENDLDQYHKLWRHCCLLCVCGQRSARVSHRFRTQSGRALRRCYRQCGIGRHICAGQQEAGEGNGGRGQREVLRDGSGGDGQPQPSIQLYAMKGQIDVEENAVD